MPMKPDLPDEEQEQRGNRLRCKSVTYGAGVVVQEWHLYSPEMAIEYSKKYHFGEEQGRTPTVTMDMVIRRSSASYLRNMFMSCFILTSVAFSSFLFDHGEEESRFEFLALIMLTILTLKMHQPKTPTTNQLDIYMNGCLGIIMVNFIESFWDRG